MKIPFCARLSPFPRGGASGDVDNQGSMGWMSLLVLFSAPEKRTEFSGRSPERERIVSMSKQRTWQAVGCCFSNVLTVVPSLCSGLRDSRPSLRDPRRGEGGSDHP